MKSYVFILHLLILFSFSYCQKKSFYEVHNK
jgi:hypothetical protein